MPGVNNGQSDVDIDLGGLFRAIWRRRGRILLATICVTGLAFVGAKFIAPDYQSETRLLIESRQPEFSGANQSATPSIDTSFDEPGISSQVQVLRSVDLIKQVAREMKLYELPEFDPTANPSAISDLLVMLGVKKNPLDLPPEERVLKEFQDKLQVYQVEKSRVIGIMFTSKDPQLAAAIPNEMAKIFLSLQSGAKLDSNSEASRWLEPEIANLREKVKDAEAKVASYRASQDLLPMGDTTTFATRQLTDISAELARVRGERANAEARADGVRAALSSGRSVDTLNDVVGSAMIQRLKENEATVQAQIADLSTSLLDGHPRLKGLKSQLQDIRLQIRSETQKILGSLENEAKVSQLREQQLLSQLNSQKATTAQAGENEVGLRALEREATAQRQLLETYLARYREAMSRTGSYAPPADARVISQAIEPTEVHFPKVLPITIVAALATFLISCVIIMLSELFTGRALRPVGDEREEDFEDQAWEEPETHVRPAAVVAPVPARSQPAPRQPAPAFTAAPKPAYVAPRFDAARVEETRLEEADIEDQYREEEEETSDFSVASVAAHICDNDVRLIVSVSPGGDAGSTATVMLARQIAEEGRKIILIDLTGSACPTRLMAHAPNLPGITNLLVGEVPFTETIHGDRLSDVHIIPQGDADIGLAMRGIERLQIIIDALLNAYDIVLVECGAASVGAVRKITRSTETDIIVSAPDVDEETIVRAISGFGEAGYSEIMLMTEVSRARSEYYGQRTA